MRVKRLAPPVDVEPPRSGEDAGDCVACNTPDDAYIWVSERWRVRAMDRPTGLPAVLVLECRSHFDLGDLTNLLAAELGVMTVRLERAIRSLDGVARVHVNRWGDGSAHLHLWFLARPYGRLQLRGTFLSLWDDILPVVPEHQWQENLGLVAAWLADFGGRAIAEPPHIAWQSPGTMGEHRNDTAQPTARPQDLAEFEAASSVDPGDRGVRPVDDGRAEREGSEHSGAGDDGVTRDLRGAGQHPSADPDGEAVTHDLSGATQRLPASDARSSLPASDARSAGQSPTGPEPETAHPPRTHAESTTTRPTPDDAEAGTVRLTRSAAEAGTVRLTRSAAEPGTIRLRPPEPESSAPDAGATDVPAKDAEATDAGPAVTVRPRPPGDDAVGPTTRPSTS